eukprot:2486456-Rhodomonas_salina.1
MPTPDTACGVAGLEEPAAVPAHVVDAVQQVLVTFSEDADGTFDSFKSLWENSSAKEESSKLNEVRNKRWMRQDDEGGTEGAGRSSSRPRQSETTRTSGGG